MLKMDKWNEAFISQLQSRPVDILVFAPHPDDEILGTAGSILKATGCGKRVHVVFFTNGDGYPSAAARLFNKQRHQLLPSDFLELARIRQYEAITAAARIGLRPIDLTFLGYPDAGLDQVYLTTKGMPPYEQPLTKRQATYGKLMPDFHSQLYGCHAPYRKACALSDTKVLIQALQPKEIYVTDAADTHRDHQAAHAFIMEAAADLGYKGCIYTYLIHGGIDSQWPWPRGITPKRPFESHTHDGHVYPMDVPWPPPFRCQLTQGQTYAKWQALLAYRSQMAIDAEFLTSFIKCEEIFWLPDHGE
ncbi:PIG-L deacetylase family protein [Paenibacillus roseipurpureus]|uniref:PIG-L family deacetylase n=1 Tax=Paenibacillus roseopurpureus TaxID=2918901 RepID=A0AA96LPW3_9BACL|nr:PIG-L family deacetylase [Paenibacillus sp. MBLB1832]WNR44969.1 PIG-L family deacetylase [Paenibacillus sp. MBLB1832]